MVGPGFGKARHLELSPLPGIARVSPMPSSFAWHRHEGIGSNGKMPADATHCSPTTVVDALRFEIDNCVPRASYELTIGVHAQVYTAMCVLGQIKSATCLRNVLCCRR